MLSGWQPADSSERRADIMTAVLKVLGLRRIRNPTPPIDTTRIYLKKKSAKFHPDPI